MLVIFNKLQDILLVSFGAILGVNIRFIIYKEFDKLNFNTYYSILIINTLASFFLGFFLSILTRISSYDVSYQLALLVSIGLLGSLSTLSTFVYDLFDFFIQLKFFKALKLFFLSLLLGIIALACGSFIGR